MVANAAYLEGFHCPALPWVAPYCARGGVRVVSKPASVNSTLRALRPSATRCSLTDLYASLAATAGLRKVMCGVDAGAYVLSQGKGPDDASPPGPQIPRPLDADSRRSGACCLLPYTLTRDA